MKQNKSETLLQREKAQRDLLELKKIQRGEIEAETLKEGYAPIIPQTFEEKKENFLFYHKYKLLAGLFALIVLAVFIVSSATKIRYDAKTVFFCYNYYTEEQAEKNSRFFEAFYEDLNGNGKVDVLTVNCTFSQNAPDAEYAKSMLTKVQTLLVGEDDTMLYILDKNALDFLNGISNTVTLFKEDNIVSLGADYFGAIEAEPSELYLCLRTVDGTSLEGKAKDNYDAARRVFERISLSRQPIQNQN